MRRHLISALALLLASVSFVSAQETTTGSITGEVIDAQGAPVPGATVSLVSNQGTKTFVTDASGRFFAPFLTPGTYNVRAELMGFSPVEQKNVKVSLGQRVELNGLALKVGGLEEVVEVVGSAPTIDTNTTTVGGVLDSELMKRLPVGRNFTDTLYLVAGVSDSSGVGAANPSIGGASGLDNNYVVDGINISNTGFGGVGTYSIVFGSLGTGVTTDFIKETQVKTGGFEAEYGQATGGVVNVVTQSGTNSFHGAVYGYGRPYGLTSDFKQLETPNGTVNIAGDQNFDVGMSLGGPLMTDKLFFFGAFNPQYQSRKFTAPANFPLASLGAVERKRRIHSYAGKLSWQATPNHRFDASAFGDPSQGENGPQRATALLANDKTRFSELESYGGHQQSLRYDGIISRNWLVEASFARSTNSLNEIPEVNEWSVTDRTVTPNRRTGGIGFYDRGGVGKNLQYQLKSTHILDMGGNHQLRYGVGFEDIAFARDQDQTGPAFTLANGTLTRTGASAVSILPDPVFGRIWRVGRANFGPVPETTANYLNFFAQDTWQIGKRLTLRPGLRLERQKLVGGGAPLCHADDSRPGAGDGTGEAIFCEKSFGNNITPRLGATYDPLGNGKAKVYVSWGRFLSKIPNDLAARSLSADPGISRADYFDAGLTRPVPNGTVAAGQTQHLILTGLRAAVFDPDAKPTYTQELLGGFEFEAARSLNIGVRYIHRSIPRVLEDVGTLSMTAENLLADPGDVEYFITNIGPQIQTTCLPGYPCGFETPVHIYDAVELTMNKTFADNWGLMGSYRWSRLKGNFEGFFRSDNGQSDPSITSLFDYPTNDPSYAAVGGPELGFRGDIRYLGDSLGRGVLPNDRTHQVKLYGTRSLGSLNIGAGFNVGSGRPLTALAANPSYNNAGEVPETLRGAGIQTVAVSGCRECGSFETRSPVEMSLDGHFDYTVKFGNQRAVFLADVFNVTNRRAPTDYDLSTESSFGSANPNFGYPISGVVGATASYQLPRQIRLGARFEW